MTIRELIREALDTQASANPHDIASEVLHLLDAHHDCGAGGAAYRDALAETLPTYIRTEFSRSRMLNGAPLPQDTSDTPVKPSGASSKVAACRDAWDARKNTPLLVGAKWMKLADCTAADLLTVAASLRERAATVVSKAEWFETLASALPEGTTVAALASDPTAVA